MTAKPKISMKQLAAEVLKEAEPDDIADFLKDEKRIIEFFAKEKGRPQNAAVKVLNSYYTNQFKKAIKSLL